MRDLRPSVLIKMRFFLPRDDYYYNNGGAAGGSLRRNFFLRVDFFLSNAPHLPSHGGGVVVVTSSTSTRYDNLGCRVVITLTSSDF